MQGLRKRKGDARGGIAIDSHGILFRKSPIRRPNSWGGVVLRVTLGLVRTTQRRSSFRPRQACPRYHLRKACHIVRDLEGSVEMPLLTSSKLLASHFHHHAPRYYASWRQTTIQLTYPHDLPVPSDILGQTWGSTVIPPKHVRVFS